MICLAPSSSSKTATEKRGQPLKIRKPLSQTEPLAGGGNSFEASKPCLTAMDAQPLLRNSTRARSCFRPRSPYDASDRWFSSRRPSASNSICIVRSSPYSSLSACRRGHFIPSPTRRAEVVRCSTSKSWRNKMVKNTFSCLFPFAWQSQPTL
jgi:hypothetical protein